MNVWEAYPGLDEAAKDMRKRVDAGEYGGNYLAAWEDMCERHPEARATFARMSPAEFHYVLTGQHAEDAEDVAPSITVPVTLRDPNEPREPIEPPPTSGLAAWMPSLCQLGGSPVARSIVPEDTPPPTLLPYRCPDPSCKRGRWPDGQRCMCCNGAAYVTAEQAGGWMDDGQELQPAPLPPGIMRNPCPGCALRPGSPERSIGADPPLDRVFWCHKGMEQDEDGNYLPAMEYMGVPVGYLVCRGWYNAATGIGPQPDDLEPYREEKLPDRAAALERP